MLLSAGLLRGPPAGGEEGAGTAEGPAKTHGLGSARSLESYARASGVNFTEMTVSDCALNGGIFGRLFCQPLRKDTTAASAVDGAGGGGSQQLPSAAKLEVMRMLGIQL